MLSELLLHESYAFFFIIEFAIVSMIILFAGMKLAQDGEKIGEISGLGQTWVGVTLLGVVTSLPELISGITGVLLNSHDLAVSNVFGSNVFNVFLVGILDMIQGEGPIMRHLSIRQILPAASGVLLSAVAAFAIIAAVLIPDSSDIIGLFFSIMIFILFLVSSRMIYVLETSVIENTCDGNTNHKNEKLIKPIIRFAICSIIVIVAGIWLITLSKALSTFPFQISGNTIILGETIVGTLLLAMVTSLPEVVVSVSALRMGAMDMAVANLFGSCAFNIFIITLLELFVKNGSIFSYVSISILIPAILSIILMSIAVMGLVYRSHKSYFSLGWDGILIFFFYITGNIILFKLALTVK